MAGIKTKLEPIADNDVFFCCKGWATMICTKFDIKKNT